MIYAHSSTNWKPNRVGKNNNNNQTQICLRDLLLLSFFHHFSIYFFFFAMLTKFSQYVCHGCKRKKKDFSDRLSLKNLYGMLNIQGKIVLMFIEWNRLLIILQLLEHIWHHQVCINMFYVIYTFSKNIVAMIHNNKFSLYPLNSHPFQE